MTLDDLKRTIAQTSGTDLPSGTSFLVSATHALTCAHCVVDKTGVVAKSLQLRFSTWDKGRVRRAYVEAVDRQRDVALLRLARAAPVSACPRAANGVNGAVWQSFGHPTPVGKVGITIGGVVVDSTARTGQKRERYVMQLRCHEASDNLHGASGSPVFSDGRIVGMITNQAKQWGRADALGRREVENAYRALFAVPMLQAAENAALRDAVTWVDAAPVPTTPTSNAPDEAQLRQRYAMLVESLPKLSSLKVPGASGAIETVPLESLFVEPVVGDLARLDDLWQRRRVALVGDEGAGKSGLLKHLNLRLLRAPAGSPSAQLWPLHVELDRFAKQTAQDDLLAFGLDDLLGRDDQPALRAHLETCARDERLVLLCHGLEHVGPAHDRVVDALGRHSRFVVAVRSGRPVDIGQESGGTLRLQPLDRRRIAAFVGKWMRTIAPRRAPVDARQLVDEIVANASLLELARSPRFLSLICAAASNGVAMALTRTALLSAAWHAVWHATLGDAPYARRRAAARALGELARHGVAQPAATRYGFDEDALFDALGRAGEQDADALVERLVEYDVLVPSGGAALTARLFRFSFDSFQDYLAAAHLADDDAFLDNLSALRLDTRWARVLPIVAGILGDGTRPLDTLHAFFRTLSGLATAEALGMHACLVAECLAEANPALLPELAPWPARTAAALLDVWEQRPTARTQLLRALRRLRPTEAGERFRTIALDPTRSEVQRAPATFGLSAFGDDATLSTLTGLVADGAPKSVRMAALLALSAHDHADAVQAQLRGLRDAETQVQALAARCLAARRDRSLAPALIDAWHASSSQRDAIEKPLQRIVIEVAWHMAFATLRSEATLPALLSLVGNGDGSENDGGAPTFAMLVLAEAGVRAAVAPGIEVLESSTSDKVRYAAAMMLLRLGTAPAVAALRRAFARGDEAARLGAFEGFAAVEQRRNDPAAQVLGDAVETNFSWAWFLDVERSVVESQIANVRAALQERVSEEGIEAVRDEALRAFALPAAAASAPAGDALAQLIETLTPDEAATKRLVAFETLQALGGDPDMLLDALFDPAPVVVARAATWVRLNPGAFSAEALLDRLDALPSTDAIGLAYWSAIGALARPARLGALVARYRADSRAAADALWFLCLQFGLRLYKDGRVELPDQQIETNLERLAERLQRSDEGAPRRAETPPDPAAELALARDEWQDALRSVPADAAGWASLASLQWLLGDAEPALAALAKAAEAEPAEPLWQRLHASLSSERQSDAPHVDAVAIARAQRAAALGDLDSVVNDLGAVDAAQAGRFLEAAEPLFWPAYLLRSRRRIAAGDLPDAHTDAKRVILGNALHPQARVLRARVWVDQGLVSGAVLDLIDLANRTVDAEAADALVEALDELTTLSGVAEPTDRPARAQVDARGVRGAVLAILGRLPEARADLEGAIDAGADDGRMLNTLAWLYAGHFGVELERACDLARRALVRMADDMLANDFDRGQVLHTLGWACHLRGLRDEAVEALDEAATLCPDDEEVARCRAIARGNATGAPPA